METVITRFVGRSIVTDGTFVYNCGYEDRLQSGGVVRQVMDTALMGVIGSHDKIELPEKFNGYPIKLIGRVHVYEKGHDFPDFDSGWTCIPTRYRPGTWNMVLRYFPNEHSLIEKTKSAPAEVILGKTKIDEYAFAGTDIRKVVFSETPRKIQNYTFQDCKCLERVELAPGLERIGFRAFAGCEKLKHLVLPHTVLGLSYCDRFLQSGTSRAFAAEQCLQPRLEAPPKESPLRKFILRDLLTQPPQVFLMKYQKLLFAPTPEKVPE